MKLTELIAFLANINYVVGSVLIFREGQLEKSGKWTRNREFPCYALLKVCRILANVPCYLFLDIQLQFYFIIRKYSTCTESENVD